MSEQTAEATATEAEAANSNEQQGETEQPKPTETVDFWKAKAREQEKRAKDNAEAAKRLADMEESQKSEADKAADRVTKAEQRATEAEARALRREVALDPAGDGSLSSLSTDDANLLDALTDEDAMRRLAKRLAAANEDKRKNGNHVPREGATQGQGKPDDRRAFADFLTGNSRT